nr:putative SH protein [Paramyxoviridae sp.]
MSSFCESSADQPLYMNNIDLIPNTAGSRYVPRPESLKIRFLKDLNKLKNLIFSMYRWFLGLTISSILIYVVAIIVSQIIVTKSIERFEHILEKENLEIMNDLRQLYKECKENPLNFDWTTQIFDRIEDIEKRVPKKVIEQFIISLRNDEFNDILSEKNIPNPLDNNHVFVSLDQGSGIRIRTKLPKFQYDTDTSDDGFQVVDHNYNNRQRRTRERKRTRWIGPTGLPGYPTNG